MGTTAGPVGHAHSDILSGSELGSLPLHTANVQGMESQLRRCRPLLSLGQV